MPETAPGTRLMPRSVEELAAAMAECGAKKESISLGGQFSKRLMGGPIQGDVTLTTSGMNRVLLYEPRDLTISVEAGIPFVELRRVLGIQNQILPLDPPFSDTATLGGILGANTCGSRRLAYGSARDMVIGMKFATMAGKLVQTGGMVVKNVAGLDMAKLMIGSFGTLAAIGTVNLRVAPRPSVDSSVILSFDSHEPAFEARDRLLKSALQPVALDLLNELAAAELGYKGWVLAIRFSGNAASVERCVREAGVIGGTIQAENPRFWRAVQNFGSRFLNKFAEGSVVRVSSSITGLREVVPSIEGPAMARAGSGVCYGFFLRTEAAAKWMTTATRRGWKAVMESAPDGAKQTLDLWPAPGKDLVLMKQLKQLFDPENLLNRGRFYRII